MNNEIKEIFDIKELFKEWKQFLKWCYENNDKTVEIHRDKLKWTMDYITNLQEENDRHFKEAIRYENACDELEIRIDKTIEYINKFWKNKSYYGSIENCLKFATMNEFEKEDLLDLLQGSDKDE